MPLTQRSVIQKDLKGNYLNSFSGIRQAAKQTGTNHSHIINCCKGNRKTANGYKWEYAQDQGFNAKSTQREWQESETSAQFTYKGSERIVTLHDALRVADVDLDKWEVEKWIKNSWDVTSKGDDGKPQTTTNHQVKIWFKPKIAGINYDKVLNDFRNQSQQVRNIRYKTLSPSKVYIGLADFHIGAYVESMGQTQPFNTKKLQQRLWEVAAYINSVDASEVYIGALGDFIESFTGLNHINSWKGLEHGMHGAQAVIVAAEILADFLGKISNLVAVDMVSGNHDRVTSSNKEDVKGEVADLIAELLRHKLPDVCIRNHSFVLSRVINDVCFIQKHGDKDAKRPISDVILDYGKQGMYNVVVSGHWHSRRKKEAYRVVDGFMADKASYRAMTLPPLFTGNYYSETNGWSSTAGFIMMHKNLFGQLESRDVMI